MKCGAVYFHSDHVGVVYLNRLLYPDMFGHIYEETLEYEFFCWTWTWTEVGSCLCFPCTEINGVNYSHLVASFFSAWTGLSLLFRCYRYFSTCHLRNVEMHIKLSWPLSLWLSEHSAIWQTLVWFVSRTPCPGQVQTTESVWVGVESGHKCEGGGGVRTNYIKL